MDVMYTSTDVTVDFRIKATVPTSSATGEKNITVQTGAKNIPVQTGDESNLMSWFTLFLASSAVMALVTAQRVIQRRK